MAGVGTVAAVLELVLKFYNGIEHTTESYGSLKDDASTLERLLEDARPTLQLLGRTDTYNGCTRIVRDIRELLSRYPSLGTDNQNFQDMVRWQFAASRIPGLRQRLIIQLGFLNNARNAASPSLQGEPFPPQPIPTSPGFGQLPTEPPGGQGDGQVWGHTLAGPTAEGTPLLPPERIGSPATTVNTDYGQDPPSTGISAIAASSSQTLPHHGSSVASAEFASRSAARGAERKFIDAARKGDSITLSKWIKDNARRSLLDQESFNKALIAVSGNEKCGRGRTEVARLLLEECAAETECRDEKYGRTPLIWAVSVGRDDNLPIIKLLVGQRASLDATDNGGMTPLLWAAKRGAFKAVEVFLGNIREPKLIDAKDKDGKTALALACTQGYGAMAKSLIRHGANTNSVLGCGQPLLISAIKGAQDGFVQLLVEHGADVQRRDINGIPALSIAVFSKSLSIVQILVNKGADLEARDSQGRTALLWAVIHRRTEIVEALLKMGANRDVRDNESRSAQHWAKHVGGRKILALVCKKS